MNSQDKLEAKLLAGTALNSAERQQVAASPRLRELADFMGRLTAVDLGADPPPAADAAIRRHARRQARPALLVFLRPLLAAAALLLLFIGVGLWLRQGSAERVGPGIALHGDDNQPLERPAEVPAHLAWDGESLELELFEMQAELAMFEDPARDAQMAALLKEVM